MNQAFSFVKLDLMTVKPYLTLKNLLLLLVVMLVIPIGTDSSVSAMAILLMYASLYVTYPFAVGEQNGIDTLYPTLSIRRRTVVLGRYLFAIVLDVCAGVFSYAFTFVLFLVLKREFNTQEAFVSLLVIFAVFTIIQAIQLPIYFKLGYAKAKLIAYLPLIGFPLAIMAVSNFLATRLPTERIANFFQWVTINPYISILLGALVLFWIMFISHRISVAHYKKRDF